MKLKNLLFVFCLALLAGCQKDPDTESTPVRDTDKVEGVIRMKLDRETAEALNVIRTRSGRVLTGNISFDELCERYNVTGMERLFADNGCAERTRKAGLDLWYIIRFEGFRRAGRRRLRGDSRRESCRNSAQDYQSRRNEPEKRDSMAKTDGPAEGRSVELPFQRSAFPEDNGRFTTTERSMQTPKPAQTSMCSRRGKRRQAAAM